MIFVPAFILVGFKNLAKDSLDWLSVAPNYLHKTIPPRHLHFAANALHRELSKTLTFGGREACTLLALGKNRQAWDIPTLEKFRRGYLHNHQLLRCIHVACVLWLAHYTGSCALDLPTPHSPSPQQHTVPAVCMASSPLLIRLPLRAIPSTTPNPSTPMTEFSCSFLRGIEREREFDANLAQFLVAWRRRTGPRPFLVCIAFAHLSPFVSVPAFLIAWTLGFHSLSYTFINLDLSKPVKTIFCTVHHFESANTCVPFHSRIWKEKYGGLKKDPKANDDNIPPTTTSS